MKKNAKITIIILSTFLFFPAISISATCQGIIDDFTIGLEYVAECTDAGSSSRRYVETTIKCLGNVVVRESNPTWLYSGSLVTGDAIIQNIIGTPGNPSPIANMVKVFSNSEKTHIVQVTDTYAKYNGYLEGVALKPLHYGNVGVHYDLFSDVFVIPESGSIDLDVDNDNFHTCTDCDDNNSAINPAAAEICSDGADNNCDGFADCNDASCVDDAACAVSTDVNPENFPKDCGLETSAN